MAKRGRDEATGTGFWASGCPGTFVVIALFVVPFSALSASRLVEELIFQSRDHEWNPFAGTGAIHKVGRVPTTAISARCSYGPSSPSVQVDLVSWWVSARTTHRKAGRRRELCAWPSCSVLDQLPPAHAEGTNLLQPARLREPFLHCYIIDAPRNGSPALNHGSLGLARVHPFLYSALRGRNLDGDCRSGARPRRVAAVSVLPHHVAAIATGRARRRGHHRSTDVR